MKVKGSSLDVGPKRQDGDDASIMFHARGWRFHDLNLNTVTQLVESQMSFVCF